MDRLFVAVLGHRNSGKSTTWNELFGRVVRTGTSARTLQLYGGECAEVFLISGSPEERDKYAGDLLTDPDCRIVLCSMQYVEHVDRTLKFVAEQGFEFHVQWLNPGHHDAGHVPDHLGLVPQLLHDGATLAIRDGKLDARPRVEEIRQLIHGWAKARGLTFPCP